MIKEGVIISGRYEIMNRIGMGGMADVYKAMDRKLNRYVAVKVLKREFRDDETFVRKFQTEAQSAAGLLHPNIVNVYDVGEDHGLYYIVMELVEGITLKDYIEKKGSLTPKEVISIAIQVCAGMEVAHNNNIVHRDIKPQNIMISKEGKVKVTDFGIAKATSSNTISTNAMGSVHYTSPEQARGGFSDAKSDIYSLGITMYEMITGELPFDGDSTVSVALKHLQEDITPPSEIVPGIPYSLERIILKCTQKSPDRRYAEIGHLERDLRRSLVDPEGDFVVIAPYASANTRVITPDELGRIQQEADYDDYDDDDYDYDDDEDYGKKKSSKKSDVDPKMAKIMKILAGVITAIFIFILILLVARGTGIFKIGPGNGSSVSTQTNIVPELVGKTEEEAKKACEEAGLQLRVTERRRSEKYEAGIVDGQKTQEGTKLPAGAVVQVIVSSGLLDEEITIPSVSGKEEAEAIDELVKVGFDERNIHVIAEESSSVQPGVIIRTEPGEGEKIAVSDMLILYVSKEKEKPMVPVLVGKMQEEAEEALSAAGLNGEAEEVFSEKPAGEVIFQELESGKTVDKGTTVKYKVSKGPEVKDKVKIPTGLTGKSYSSVKAILGNLGLEVTPVYEESYDYKENQVVHVEGSGQEVEAGTHVTVVISTGPGPSNAPVAPEIQ